MTDAIRHPTVRQATSQSEIATCLAIREAVFTFEQGVPPELELDAFDAVSTHYLAFVDGTAQGTGRVRMVDGMAKVQRVAVLAPARGTGLGAALMARIVADLCDRGEARAVTLGSQESAVGFYERLGFRRHGERFMDAGIPHFEMRLALDRVRATQDA